MGSKNRRLNRPFDALSKHKIVPKRPAPETAGPKPGSNTRGESSTRDQELFANYMSGVEPLPERDRRTQGPIKPRPVAPRTNDEDEVVAELEALVSGELSFEMHESEEFLSGAAPGVNHKLLAELRRGEHSYRRYIDLHGHNRDEAKTSLAKFIAECRRNGERCVLIVTGRGRKSPGGISVLRESLPRWLTRHPNRAHVLAFCTARPVDGGPGAFYVLLRRPGVRPFG